MNYFSDHETKCKCCGITQLAPGFLDRLNSLRAKCGHPLVINSMCRCRKYNEKVDGKAKSFHLINSKELTGVDGCCAADISTVNWTPEQRKFFIAIVKAEGWSLGVGKTFLHVDRRIDYPESGWKKPGQWIYT